MVIIGYGNPHRQDDRAGHCVAGLVQAWAGEHGAAQVKIVTAYQLDLDMVEEIAQADAVYFSDAHVLSYSAEIVFDAVTPDMTTGFTTHLITPAGLLALSQQLYHHTPHGYIVSVPGEWFDMGDEMSPRAAQQAADAARMLIDHISTAGR